MQACFNIVGLTNIMPIPSCRIQYVNKKHILPLKLKKPPIGSLFCGERGIRTPVGFTQGGFQDRCNQPLCHLSGRESNTNFNSQTFFDHFTTLLLKMLSIFIL